MVLDKGKVVSVKKGFATVQVGGSKRRCEVRQGTKIKKGDSVVVAFGVVVDKI